MKRYSQYVFSSWSPRQLGKPGLSEERYKIVCLRKRIIRTSSRSPSVPTRVQSYIGCTCMNVGDPHWGVTEILEQKAKDAWCSQCTVSFYLAGSCWVQQWLQLKWATECKMRQECLIYLYMEPVSPFYWHIIHLLDQKTLKIRNMSVYLFSAIELLWQSSTYSWIRTIEMDSLTGLGLEVQSHSVGQVETF